MNDDSSKVISIATDGHVATVTIRRPPHNFINAEVVGALADALAQLDTHSDCRAIVLASVGKSFCAGADFSGQTETPAEFYKQAMRLFDSKKPLVAAVQGAAVGGGVGLALVADFRISCRNAKFSVNFTRLGIHPGFGLTLTLPRLIGEQRASLLLYTGRRIDGEEALAMNLIDELVHEDEVLMRAKELAREIAISAPLAVQSTRQSLRLNLAEQIRAMNSREQAEQAIQQNTADFREGVLAMSERRLPVFLNR
jgi:enoyl-CoA hydratase/carnithine racemase